MSDATIEYCPADASESHSAFLDTEIRRITENQTRKLENGERASYKKLGWRVKLDFVRRQLGIGLDKAQADLSAGDSAASGRIEYLGNQLAYAQSLSFAAQLAELVAVVHKASETDAKERMHVPVTRSERVSRLAGLHLLSHVREMSREADPPLELDVPWTFEAAEYDFTVLLAELTPGTSFQVANIGDVAVNVTPVGVKILHGVDIWLAKIALEESLPTVAGPTAATA